MNQAGMLTRFVTETEIDAVMVAGRFTLLDQSAADELLPACADRGVSVLAAGGFNSGLLGPDEPPALAPYDYAPAPPEILARAPAVGAGRPGAGGPLPPPPTP